MQAAFGMRGQFRGGDGGDSGSSLRAVKGQFSFVLWACLVLILSKGLGVRNSRVDNFIVMFQLSGRQATGFYCS